MSVYSNNIFPVYVFVLNGKTIKFTNIKQSNFKSSYITCPSFAGVCNKGDLSQCITPPLPSWTINNFISWYEKPKAGGRFTGISHDFGPCKVGKPCNWECDWVANIGTLDPKSTSLDSISFTPKPPIRNSYKDILKNSKQINLNPTEIGFVNDGWTISKEDIDNVSSGTINSYWYFKKFETGITSNDINDLSIYLSSIINNKLIYLKNKLPEIMANSIRDNSIIYAITSQFYNQIYQTGPYNNKPESNEFLHINDIYNNFSKYTSVLIGKYKNLGFLYPPQNQINSDIVKLLNHSLTMNFPIIKKENSDYYIYMYINNTQYQDVLNLTSQQNQTNYLNKCLVNFFRDNEGTIHTPKGAYNSPDIIISFDNTQLNNPPTANYNLNTFFPFNDIYNNNYIDIYNSNSKILNIEIKVKIISWSVMSMAYISKFYNQLISNDLCNTFKNSNLYTIPSSCMALDTIDTIKYKSDILSFCEATFDNFPMSHTSMHGLLLNATSDNCICYTSRVAPPNIANGNIAAMCFNSSCNDKIYNEIFDLSTENCKQYCDKAYYWMTNTNPADQPGNKSAFDWDKFRKVCGISYESISNKQYFNTKLLIPGISTSLLIILLSFLLCKNKQYSIHKTIIILTTISTISILSTFALARYFNGYSLCDKKELKCLNSYKKYIPNEFCDDIFSCECASNQDCQNGCLCMSSTCYPASGSRKSKIDKVKKPHTIQIVLGIFFSILLPLIFIYYYKDFKPHINTKILISIIIVLTLLPIIYIIYYATKKYKERVYTESCKTPTPPVPHVVPR